MVMVKSGTVSKSPSPPSTLTVTSVAVDRTTPSGREAVTVTTSPTPPSSTSALSTDSRTIISSSAMVKTAGFTFKAVWEPTTDNLLSSLAAGLSVMGMFKAAEAW